MAAKARPVRGLLLGAALALGALISLAVAANRPAGSSALWHVVHDLCVTDMKVSGLPAPCIEVNLKGRFAVLKDLRGVTQLLLMPTDRIYGIESDRLLEPDAPNYWQDAWDARPLFDKGAGRAVPREYLGLAINSAYGRTQNQLHIHIDCLKPKVRDTLEIGQRRIGAVWSWFPVAFSGHRYRVRRVMGEDLGDRDPFKLLAQDPRARIDMGRETLVVAGMVFAGGKPGFVMLSDRADLTRMDQGAGEELLDHSCAVLNPPPAPPAKAN